MSLDDLIRCELCQKPRHSHPSRRGACASFVGPRAGGQITLPAMKRDDGTFYVGEQGPPPAPTRGETETNEATDPDDTAMGEAREIHDTFKRVPRGKQIVTFAEFIRRKLGIISTNLEYIDENATECDKPITPAFRDIRAELAKLEAFASALDGSAGKGKVTT